MSLTAIFRCDAAEFMGTGHVFRCKALAQHLKRFGFQIHWITRSHNGSNNLIQFDQDDSVHWLRPCSGKPISGIPNAATKPPYAHWLGIPIEEDIAETAAVLRGIAGGFKTLIIDHYGLDESAHRALRPWADRIVVIDDLVDRRFDADMVVNANYGRSASGYRELASTKTQILCGPMYALLRPEFAELRDISLREREHRPLKHVLISLGGAERSGVTELLMQAILPELTKRDMSLITIVGSFSNARAEADRIAAQAPSRVVVYDTRADLAQLLADCDLAIGAVGMTTWERCALGVPSLHVILAENQRYAAQALDRDSLAKTVYDCMKPDPDAMAFTISEALDNPNATIARGLRSSSLSDGLGVNRVSQWIMDQASCRIDTAQN